MTSQSNLQAKPPSSSSPVNRREERERAEAQALAKIADALQERQTRSQQLRKLRLAQQAKK